MPALASREAVEAFARAVLEELEVSHGLLQAPAQSHPLPTGPSFLRQVASAPRLAVGESTAKIQPHSRPRPRTPTLYAQAPSATMLALVAEVLPPQLASRSSTPSRERLSRAMMRHETVKARDSAIRQRTLQSFNGLKKINFTPPSIDSHPRYAIAAEESAAIRARDHADRRAAESAGEQAQAQAAAFAPAPARASTSAATAATSSAGATGATHAMRQHEFDPPPLPRAPKRPNTGLDQLARAEGIGVVYAGSPRPGVPPPSRGAGYRIAPSGTPTMSASMLRPTSRSLLPPSPSNTSPPTSRPETAFSVATHAHSPARGVTKVIHPRAPPTSPETSLIGAAQYLAPELMPAGVLPPAAPEDSQHLILERTDEEGLDGSFRATSSASYMRLHGSAGADASVSAAKMMLSSSGSLHAIRPVRINRRWVHTAPAKGMRPGQPRSEHAAPPPFEPFLTALQAERSASRFTIAPNVMGAPPSTPTDLLSESLRARA